MSHSLDTESTSIALLPCGVDRGSFATGHQQCYLSPPLTPYPRYHTSHDCLDSISPVLAPYRTPLPSLQEMLPHDRRQQKSPTDSGRFRSHSASYQHPRRESKEILESSRSAMYNGGQVANDPAPLLPMYPTQNHATIPPPATIVSPTVRRNKAHVASACVNCKKAHLACEGIYPPPHGFQSPGRSINCRYLFFAASVSPFSCAPPIVLRSPAMAECGCMSTLRQYAVTFHFTFLLFSFLLFSHLPPFLYCFPGKTGGGWWRGRAVSGRALHPIPFGRIQKCPWPCRSRLQLWPIVAYNRQSLTLHQSPPVSRTLSLNPAVLVFSVAPER